MTFRRGVPRVVEFVGLPGSGKSTICQALQDQMGGAGSPYIFGVPGLRDQLHKNRRLSYRLSLVISAVASVVALPLLHVQLIWFGFRASRPSLEVLTFVRRCCHLAYEIDRFKADPCCTDLTLVLDQGLLQTIASLSVPGDGAIPESAGVTDLLIAKRLDQIIWLECDQSVSMGRLVQRTNRGSRFDEGGDGRLSSRQYERFGAVLDLVRKHVGRRHVPILALDANAAGSGNAAAVHAFLTEG